ncbi:MAG TPA: hypothetical protein VNI02_21130 [Blastocatellia bacterium]|jgi:hypothetical protein|nr:hypothetical protein [Blastocatellia bacterium]
MTIHATLVLDSGAFFQNLQAGTIYDRLDVGFFGSDGDATEIHVVVDGNPVPANETKLGQGKIEVLFKKGQGSAPGIEVTEAFINSLLRVQDLYPVDTPNIDQSKFDCVFVFTSGRFCCSMVKVRPFQEWNREPWGKTDQKIHTKKAISHNVAVHFELEDGDSLQLVREKSTVLFTTANLPKDAKRVDIDIVADNSTAVKFFRDALNLKGRTAWLPNQGDPPTVGPP